MENANEPWVLTEIKDNGTGLKSLLLSQLQKDGKYNFKSIKKEDREKIQLEIERGDIFNPEITPTTELTMVRYTKYDIKQYLR